MSEPAVLALNPTSPSKEAAKARILIADDHPLVRDGLALLISGQHDLSCCGQAGTVAETQTLVAKLQPDLIILDLRLKGGDGMELIKVLKAEHPALRIMILSQHTGALYVERALRAGAVGYVSKEHAAEELLNAIHAVLAGEIYLERGMAALLLQRFVGTRAQAAPGGIEQLTDREMHVFQLLGTGRSTREIAAELNRSFKTVESHRENIKRKLQLRGAAELVNRAIQWALEPISLSGPVEIRKPQAIDAAALL
jgi:DNA-binding NarL/FixJ family response regulator